MSILTKNYHSYRFGCSSDFSDKQLADIVAIFCRRYESANTVLGGRASICMADLDGLGPIAVNQYFRGGLIRHVNKQRYLKWSKTRGQIEYEMLEKVRDIGVNAPEPVAFVSKGFLLYKAWLITRKIDIHQSLAELSISDEKRSCMVLENVIEQLFLLIKNRILHVDLHPGNVVVDTNNKVHLLDFDEDIYGKCLEVSFVRKLRDERWFGSAEELGSQIAADILQARRILNGLI